MKAKNLWIAGLGAALLTLAATSAMGNPPNNPLDDPNKGGYNFKDDGKPWFDFAVAYPFFSDMMDGKSLKPQEEGSYQQFPAGSVPVKVELGKVVSIYDPFIPFGALRETTPANPTVADEASLARGRVMYDTYCAVCHGKDGNAGTVVTGKGVPAPPIKGFVAAFSQAHFYNKIKYGSFYQEPRGFMPAYGGQTSVQDRWDIVNYIFSPGFGN